MPKNSHDHVTGRGWCASCDVAVRLTDGQPEPTTRAPAVATDAERDGYRDATAARPASGDVRVAIWTGGGALFGITSVAFLFVLALWAASERFAASVAFADLGDAPPFLVVAGALLAAAFVLAPRRASIVLDARGLRRWVGPFPWPVPLSVPLASVSGFEVTHRVRWRYQDNDAPGGAGFFPYDSYSAIVHSRDGAQRRLFGETSNQLRALHVVQTLETKLHELSGQASH